MQRYRSTIDQDPIAYLVNLRFPRVEGIERARVAGGSLGGQSLFPSRNRNCKAAQDYRAELEKTPIAEIMNRVQAAKNAERNAESSRLMQEDALRPFNQLYADADFEHWAKMSYWTIDEAIALSFSKNPKIVSWNDLEHLVRVSPFAAQYAEKREIALRAQSFGQLWASTTPSLFLAWATRIKFSVPEGLIEAVEAVGIQIADWKTLFDKQVLQTQSANSRAEKTHSNYMLAMESQAKALDMLKEKQDQAVAKYAHRIAELEAAMSSSQERPLSTRERDSLLKLVIGMAMKGYGHDPKAGRTSTAGEIASDLQIVGLSLDEDTIRKYLSEAKELLPPEMPE